MLVNKIGSVLKRVVNRGLIADQSDARASKCRMAFFK
jgi:hypothetical protein